MNRRGSRPVDAVLIDFGRALRRAGLAVGPEQVSVFVEATGHLDPASRRQVHAAGRATCCTSPDDLPVYDRVFEDFFRTGHRPTPQEVDTTIDVPIPDDDGPDGGGDGPVGSLASDAEALRHRDLAELEETTRTHAARLLSLARQRPPQRRGRRRRSDAHGRIDPRGTIRNFLVDGGELRRLHRHRRRPADRRVVLLLDVSGSMRPYADGYLTLAHAIVRAWPKVEVFTSGTRLTRVTPALGTRRVDAALARVGEVVPDWAGGTRLGESLALLLDEWGRSGPVRGATVLVASDGWERGGADELGRQMARLRRLAHRVVWAHPHRGRQGFRAETGGMRAALPHVDAVVPGHSVASLEEIPAVLLSGRDAHIAAPAHRAEPEARVAEASPPWEATAGA